MARSDSHSASAEPTTDTKTEDSRVSVRPRIGEVVKFLAEVIAETDNLGEMERVDRKLDEQWRMGCKEFVYHIDIVGTNEVMRIYTSCDAVETADPRREVGLARPKDEDMIRLVVLKETDAGNWVPGSKKKDTQRIGYERNDGTVDESHWQNNLGPKLKDAAKGRLRKTCVCGAPMIQLTNWDESSKGYGEKFWTCENDNCRYTEDARDTRRTAE